MFGTYTCETEMVRFSSISFASFLASSTGCTFDLKVRPKPPSKVRSRRVSMRRRIPISGSSIRRGHWLRGHGSEREEYSRRDEPGRHEPDGRRGLADERRAQD